MQALRNASLLARLVLVWFALSLGVAVASPIVKPVAMQLVCSGGVAKLVAQGDDGSQPVANHTLDCPLCASFGAPPDAGLSAREALAPQGIVAQSHPSSRIAFLAAAPLPARGPPAR